jgi:hypothetical protein
MRLYNAPSYQICKQRCEIINIGLLNCFILLYILIIYIILLITNKLFSYYIFLAIFGY